MIVFRNYNSTRLMGAKYDSPFRPLQCFPDYQINSELEICMIDNSATQRGAKFDNLRLWCDIIMSFNFNFLHTSHTRRDIKT